MPRRLSLGSLLGGCCLLVALTACGGGTPTATTAPATVATVAATTRPATSTTAAASTARTGTTTTGGTTASAAPSASAPASASPAVATAARTTATAGGAAPTTGGTRFVIDPAASKASYEVKETFVGRGLATAIGSTSAISGDLTINTAKPSSSAIGTITVDISKLASDSGQRDGRIRQEWLESAKYPNATFVPKRLEGLPDAPYTEGQTLTFKIVGDLTVRTTTKEVAFDATGKISGTTFTGTAKTSFNMTDFGFNPPDIAGVLKAENGVILTLEISAKRAQ